MVRAQAPELFVEEPVEAVAILDKIVGELGSDIHFVPEVVLFEDLAQCGFAAGIDIGGIKIVYTGFNRSNDFALGLDHVYPAHLSGKAHAAEAKDGKRIAISVGTIIHKNTAIF
jgi:hypothetical protein